MENVHFLTAVKEIIQLLYLIGGLFVAIFMFLRLAPRLQFSVCHSWPAGDRDICVLKVAITSASRVRVGKERVLLLFDSLLMLLIEIWLAFWGFCKKIFRRP